MLLLTNLYNKIPIRFKHTFLWSAAIGLIIHLYVFTNGFLNHDSLFNFYANRGSDGSGRFTLKYFKGITSYFDLHYIQGVLSIIFLALTIALLVELFQLTTKWTIIPFAIIYLSYPTIAGTFAYMFTSHAYFLANLLTVVAVYLCFKLKRKWIAVIAGGALLYLVLGTYQINIAYGSTLILLLFMKELLVGEKLAIKTYISSILMLGIGLAGYVLHFKIYQKVHNLLDYNGISESGKINLETIQKANENIFKDIGFYFFNDFNFQRLFELLNVTYFALFITLLIIVSIIRKVPIWKIGLVIVSIAILPYTLYLIYFISPDVEYHLIMKQHFALIYIIGFVLFQIIVMYKNTFVQVFNIAVLGIFALIGYNQIVISNIYYEKLSDLNQETYSLMTRVAHDIQRVPGYTTDLKIAMVGYPSTMMTVPTRYNLFTPKNVGVSSRIVYDYASAYAYLANEIGLPNGVPMQSGVFLADHSEEIKTMQNWPAEGSVKIVDNTIVVKFSGGN
jgi:hypothetical protein